MSFVTNPLTPCLARAVSAALLPAVVLSISTNLHAQSKVEVVLQKIEKIEITGSNIKRIPGEGAAPVETISRKDIEKSGVTSINELLRSLAYMSSLNDELNSSAPNITGTASVGFRGLGGDQTVVLLNGRRLANYGFDGAFVNLNNIPLGAIERVELLKDGAAAIYGADAIGGVLNFITRKDFKGGEGAASVGTSSRGDGHEATFVGTAGVGSLIQDKFNALLNVSYFKREPINNLDRNLTQSADFRGLGGNNQLSTFAPSGNFINPVTGLQAPFQPCPAGLTVSPSPLTPGVAGSISCVFDFAPYRTTLFGTDRLSALATFRYAFDEHTNGFAEIILSRSDTFVSAAPAPGFFNLAVGNPVNPFNTAISVRGRPLQAGARTTDNRADASRILVGLEGVWQHFEYNLALGQAKSKATNTDGGYFLSDKLNTAIGNGSFNPFSLTNPANIANAISSADTRAGETTHSYIDLKLSGELMQLPAGSLGFAAGAVVGSEKINDVPGENIRAANVFGAIQQSSVAAKRNLTAAFFELAVPLRRDLEAQIAVRHDRYDSGTRSTTPKLALRYEPLKTLLLRASYSQGFKMPSLRDLFGGQNQSADSVQDFLGCAARNVAPDACPRLQINRLSGANADLQPEKAKSSNIGIVFEPKEFVSVAFDYFTIRKTDEIGLVPAQFVIDNTPYRAGGTATLSGNSAFSITRNAAGSIDVLNTLPGNLGDRKISGFDLSTNTSFKWRGFKFGSNSNIVYYSKYGYADQPGAPLYGRLGLLNLPRWKRSTNYTINQGAWDMNLFYSVMAAMVDKPQSTAAVPVINTDRKIEKFNTLDVGLAFSGFTNIKISATVKNLFDNTPAFSGNDSRTLGFAQVHDIRGRFFQVGASYKF